MSDDRYYFEGEFDRSFCFESYGVKIRLESNESTLLESAKKQAGKALAGNIEIIDSGDGVDHSFGLAYDEDVYFLFQDGAQVIEQSTESDLMYVFHTFLRVTVGEFSKTRVFLHAGAVGWNGKAIIIPAKSYDGKTTLVAELVRHGAEYYSDDYAVLDENGLLHPFPRLLSIRVGEGEASRTDDVAVEELGGRRGESPIPVGLVLLTEYREHAVWKPKILSVGEGIIDIIPHTLPIRENPEFCMKVLNNAVSRAIIAKSPRGDVESFAGILLNFFEQNFDKVIID